MAGLQLEKLEQIKSLIEFQEQQRKTNPAQEFFLLG